jgi:hypothetical protein
MVLGDSWQQTAPCVCCMAWLRSAYECMGTVLVQLPCDTHMACCGLTQCVHTFANIHVNSRNDAAQTAGMGKGDMLVTYDPHDICVEGEG